jgi:hypothetical protein
VATATAAKRKLVLKMSVSLDGFVAGPNGEVDWIFRTQGDDSTEWVVDTLRNAGVHIMGSGSYYDMAAFWPFSDMPFAPPMNDIPKIIFSRKGIKDGTQVDRTTRALADAKAHHMGERPGVTPTAARRDPVAPLAVAGRERRDPRRRSACPGLHGRNPRRAPWYAA